MKKINRLLSVILALVVVISSVPVFARTVTDIPNSDIIDDIFRFDVGGFLENQESTEQDPDIEKIKLLDAIGMWDDATKSKDALLTMTEFSVIMSKVKLGSENALLKVYEKDPDDRKVTYKDVFEYILHATGYYYRCAQFGNTDEALLIVADEIGLISTNPENINAFVTRGQLAKLLAKAITIDLCIMEYTSEGSYKYTVADGKNILNRFHNIYNISGFVNAVPGLAVYGGTALREGYIQIERINVNASGLSVTDYFGTRVDAYVFFDDVINEYKLVYITPAQDNLVLDIDFKDIVEIKGNEIVYVDENETELEVLIDNFINISENGKKLNSLSEMSDFKKNEGKIRLVASAKSGSYDTAIIFKYDYYVVDYIDTLQNRVGIKYGMTHNGNKYIQLDDKKINRIFVDFALVDYTKIPVGKAIRVFQCVDTGYTEIIVSKESITGQITSIYDNVLEVAGKSYRVSKNILNRITECETDNTLLYNDKLRMPELGANVTFYVVDGVIAGYTTGLNYKYAYLKSASLSRTSIDPEMTIRVFTQDGEWLDLSFSDKITLDGVSGTTKTAVSDFVKANSGTVVGNLVRISVNNEGKCTFLDTIVQSEVEAETTDDVAYVPDYPDGEIVAETGSSKWDLTDCRYFFDTNTPVFVVPNDESRENKYKAVTPSAFSGYVDYNIVAYNPDDFLHLGAIVYRGELEGATSSDEALTWLYVESMRRVVIDKDTQELGYRVMGMQFVNLRAKGKGVCQKASYYISDEKYEDAKRAGNDFVVGDFIRIKVTRDQLDSWVFEQGIERGTSKITLAPGVYDLGSIDGNTYHIFVGYLEKTDVGKMIMRLNCGAEGQRVISPRAKGIIDVAAQKTINGDFASYYEGELIYGIGVGANTSFIFKTVNAE